MATLDIDAVRAELPSLQSLSYLNTGTAGPLPTPVRDAMTDAVDADLVRGRTSRKRYVRIDERAMRVRELLAELIGVDANAVALTTGTTDGIDAVTGALPWHSGDCIVTTTIEQPAALIPLYQVRRRDGAEIRFAEVDEPFDSEAVVAAVAAQVDEHVRLLMVSHVAYGSGAVLPIAELSALARSAGALMLVDGAQTVGAIDVDVHALGCDFLRVPWSQMAARSGGERRLGGG